MSYEFKPTDPSSRFALVPSTAAALALVRQRLRPGRSGSAWAGHLVAAGENARAERATALPTRVPCSEKLPPTDVHSKLAAEDGLAFGRFTRRGRSSSCSGSGRLDTGAHAYFDSSCSPEAEDPTREAAYNVRAFKRMWSWAAPAGT